MFLSREDFVNLCKEAILTTRKELVVNNQLSGYIAYHREIKEHDYFSTNVRDPLRNTNEDEYQYRHDLIQHAGLGNCHELADVLLLKIAKEIDKRDAFAKISIMSSKTFDHVYLEIKIRLKHENNFSLWEIDAWDPRIIDISTRSDGSIKNSEALNYGYKARRLNLIYTDEINYKQTYTFFHIPKPQKGCPSRDATPEREVLNKHKRKLYNDYSIEDSIKEGKIPSEESELRYLQKASKWQKNY